MSNVVIVVMSIHRIVVSVGNITVLTSHPLCLSENKLICSKGRGFMEENLVLAHQQILVIVYSRQPQINAAADFQMLD